MTITIMSGEISNGAKRSQGGTMTVLTFISSQVAGEVLAKSFGVTDDRGRDVGARVSLWTDTYVALPSDAFSGCTAAPGTYYRADTTATRNGEPYGSGSRWHQFETTDELDAYVAKYFAAACKRAVKRHGQQRQLNPKGAA